MTEIKPLPCPFCGWGALIIKGYNHETITCRNMVGCKLSTVAFSMNEWNRRHSPLDEMDEKDLQNILFANIDHWYVDGEIKLNDLAHLIKQLARGEK